MGWETSIFRWLGFGRHNTTPPSLVPGEVGELQLDPHGNLKVTVVAAGVGPPMGLRADSPATSWSAPSGLAAHGTIREAPCLLYRVFGSNEGPAKRWIMLFDATSLPADGALPSFAIPVVEGGSFAIDLQRTRPFASGLAWAASSTPGTLTIDPGACIWLNAEYA
ncbi:hypothetical protein LVJ94_02735 [Pendulispora rubella]|uniref:Uncharacterized protein n=1 Tax=Pendulispora rubella TaxID=2741070 RepID=A0ABZ2L8A6_9BACT